MGDGRGGRVVGLGFGFGFVDAMGVLGRESMVLIYAFLGLC